MALLCVAPIMSSCGEYPVYEGSFVEQGSSARLQDAEHARFHRFYIKQFGSDIGGVISMFDLDDYTEFQSQPEHITSNPGSYYHCFRIDSGYVASNNELYLTYTDELMRRWQFSLSKKDSEVQMNLSKKMFIAGNLERIDAQNRVVVANQSNYSSVLLPEDAAWWIRQRDGENVGNQIEFVGKDKVYARDLECYSYYRDHSFHAKLPSDIMTLINGNNPNIPSESLRLGVILTMRTYRSVATSNYATAALDKIDIEGNQRLIRLRNVVDMHASNASDASLGVVIVYQDVDGDDTWSPSIDPVLASSDQYVLVFAKSSSHEAVQVLNEVARASELLGVSALATKDDVGEWRLYNVTSEQEADGVSKASYYVQGLSTSLLWSSFDLTSKLGSDGRGCMVEPHDDYRPCESILPIRN